MSSVKITIAEANLADQSSDEDQRLATDIITTWKGDPKIRAEFGDDIKTYSAYRKAEAAGRVRISGRPAKG